ncbi:MAG: amidohydrolase family protein [Anaerolineae bacterium]|jgi:imidazolonepropionase-like amidohydrolase
MLAVVHGHVHTISDGVKPGWTILIREGKIEALLEPQLIRLGGDPVDSLPPGYEILDATGKTVLPGLIDARTSAGLFGDGSGFQNADHEELTDPDSAWVRAVDAINPADPAFADARQAGVTTLLAGPGTTNVAGGLSAVVKTAGETVDAMLVCEPAGLQIGLGRPPVDAYRGKNKLWTRMGVVALLRERLTAARAYLLKQERADEASGPGEGPGSNKTLESDFRLEPYASLLRRDYPARIRVATAEDTWTVLRLADEFGFDLVLEQVTEGHLAGLPEELARRGTRCVVGPMMKAGKTPETQALTFRTAAILSRAGLPIALCTGHPSRPVRYLTLEAALAVRAGLEETVALQAITLNAAAALGLADRLGSIEPGKDADLAIFDGDPLLPTSRVTQTLIGGRVVYDLEDREEDPEC